MAPQVSGGPAPAPTPEPPGPRNCGQLAGRAGYLYPLMGIAHVPGPDDRGDRPLEAFTVYPEQIPSLLQRTTMTGRSVRWIT